MVRGQIKRGPLLETTPPPLTAKHGWGHAVESSSSLSKSLLISNLTHPVSASLNFQPKEEKKGRKKKEDRERKGEREKRKGERGEM